jgi:hypothetical protein
MSNDSLTRLFMSSSALSSSARHDFVNMVLNMGGSGEGEGSGTNNDVVS